MADNRFNRLLSCSFLASMGDKFFSISLSWWILNESGMEDSDLALGLVMAVTGFCTMIFVPMLGSLADVYDRRRCMLISMSTSMLSLVALLATYRWLQEAPEIFCGVSVVLGVLTAFFMSAVQSSISFLVPRERVAQAVSLAVMATPASQVIGASIAGFAIAAFGIRGSLSCDLLLYIAGFCLLLSVPTLNARRRGETGGERAGSAPAPRQSWVQTLKEGLRYLTGERPLFHSLIFFACINLFFSPILIIMPMLATNCFNGNSVTLAMMEGCYSAGLIVMSFILNRNRRKFNRHTFIFRSILFMGISLVVVGVGRMLWLIYAMLFICGAMLSLANVSLGSIYQMYVPTEMKGRFFSLMQVTVRAASPIGFALVGLFSDMIGVRVIVLVNGLVIFGMSFLWLALRKLDFNYTF